MRSNGLRELNSQNLRVRALGRKNELKDTQILPSAKRALNSSSRYQSQMRGLRYLISAFFCFVLTACGPEKWAWQDEVEASPGQTILVDREVVFAGQRLPWETVRGQSEWILRFAHPSDPAKKVEYRSPGGLAPVAIFFVGDQIYVLGLTWRSDAVTYYDCPTPPYIVHVHRSGSWKRVDFSVVPKSLNEFNLSRIAGEGRENARAGRRSSKEQIAALNSYLSTVLKTEHETRIVRPKDDKVVFDCRAIGETAFGDDYKADFKKRSMPKGIE